ncbi:hypothetical protein BC834DRAFT_966177 [Gloeopeniophorella convolvens]|nr:hypothetical protein BC834DRAFT_966177 [Gloeopeniophorella convolvens]
MSDSPADDAFDDPKLGDELDEGAQAAGNSDSGAPAATPAKRGRGRPKGSKNKRPSTGTTGSASEAAPATGEKRKRGRPPKPKNPEEETATGEPPVKRKRGRPPKNPKPAPAPEDAGEGGTSEPPVKRKRGRPPKNASS